MVLQNGRLGVRNAWRPPDLGGRMETLPDEAVNRKTDSADRPPGEPVTEGLVRAVSEIGAESVSSLIADIRTRMSELAARELALRKREQQSEQRFREFQKEAQLTARRESRELHDRLRRRSDELDAQSIELAVRGNRIRELEERLAQRQIALEEAQRQLGEQTDHIRQRNQAYRETRHKDHESLRQRVALIRERERELKSRIGRAHADVTRQRSELEERESALQARVAELEASKQELQARKAALEAEVAALQGRADELSTEHEALLAERAEADERRRELDQAGRQLEQDQAVFAEKQHRLDVRWRSGREQRHELARHAEELDARRRVLEEQKAALDQRAARLNNYEEQLRGRAATLDNEATRLTGVGEELDERRSSIDELVERTQQTLKDAEERREEADALREQAEAREADSRQSQLSVELEREELVRERATLEEAQHELDGQRAQREADLAAVQTAIAAQAEALQRAQHAVLSRPGRWWLRAGAVALCAGALAGLAWYHFDQPAYRATSELRLVGEAAPSPDATWAHEYRLQTRAVIEQVLTDAGERQVWQVAEQDGRTLIEADLDAGTIRVCLDGPEADAARVLTSTLAGRYAELAPMWVDEPRAQAQAELRTERARLAGQLDDARQQQDTRAEQLQPLARAAVRDELRDVVARLRGEYEEEGAALAAERLRLADLEAGAVPRGTVMPADFERSLLDDEMYQADLMEFNTVASDYRSEVVVAMLLVLDPLQALRDVSATFITTLDEQHDLQPPPEIAAVLEQCSSDVSVFNEQLAVFAEEWSAAVDELRALEPERQVIELIKQQTASADGVRKLGGDAFALAEGIRARLEQLAQGSAGGTREVVVSAVVRGELGTLSASIGALVQAGQSTDLTQNFQLDALDRQLRGVQARIERRQTSVRQILQFEADERARREHTLRVSDLRAAVQDRENRREGLIEQFSKQLDELRRVDEEVAQRLELEADLRRSTADIARTEREIARIDEQLAAEQSAERTPRLEVGATTVEMIAGVDRQRHAAVAASGAFVATFLFCVLMVVRNPWRRRPKWEASFAELSSAITPEPASEDEREA